MLSNELDNNEILNQSGCARHGKESRSGVKFTIKIWIFDEHLNEVLQVTEEYFILLVNPGRL